MRGLRRVCQPFLDGDDPSDVVAKAVSTQATQWVGWTDWI